VNIKVCDICWCEKDENSDFLRVISKSTYRISFKKPRTGQRIALSACAKHADFFKDCKSYDEAVAKYDKLLEKAPFTEGR